jgi:hypothetical protein
MKWRDLRSTNLVKNDGDDSRFETPFGIGLRKIHGAQNGGMEKRRNLYNAAACATDGCRGGIEVERPQFNPTRHRNAVGDPSRDPHRASGRNHPEAVIRLDRYHARRGVNQLG